MPTAYIRFGKIRKPTETLDPGAKGLNIDDSESEDEKYSLTDRLQAGGTKPSHLEYVINIINNISPFFLSFY